MSEFPQQQQFQYPDRSTLILVLGILSILLCNILGPIAWVMGRGDLAKIQAGQMTPTVRDEVKAGMVCGIIGTVFLGLGLLVGIVLFVLIVVFGMAIFAGANGATP